MDSLVQHFLWSEKYRPQRVSDCILPERLKKPFEDFIKKGEIPHLLLTGTAGTGKTTVALAMCQEMGCDTLYINASLENGIDVLRTKITAFASSVSMMGDNNKTKVVILDESDYLNPTSTQPALRGFMQDYAQNCRFIFTCNFKNKLIPPLHSRTVQVEFKMKKEEKKAMAEQFLKRTFEILKAEKITFNKQAVAQLVAKNFPDFRKVLNELQQYSSSGTIDEGILLNSNEADFGPLFKALKEKDWKPMRAWVVQNNDQDTATVFRSLYDKLMDVISPQYIPQLVLILADYQYKSAFAVDQEINTVACLTEIMSAVEFK